MSADTAAPEKFKLYSIPELRDLQEPGWLIEKLFPEGALVGLYGPSGEGKTFLALDWALSIAQGGKWLGWSVQQGPVVYVAAEGGRSIRKRVAAWMHDRECPSQPSAFFILEGVQIRDDEDLVLLAEKLEGRRIGRVCQVVEK